MPDDTQAPVTPSEARTEARVSFDGGRVFSAPPGTAVEAYYVAASPELIPPARQSGQSNERTVVAAIVNEELRELTYPVVRDSDVRAVTMHDGDGMRIYRRSLSFVLRVAAEETFPDFKLTIEHALPFGGFYCRVVNGPPLTGKQLAHLKDAMQAIIDDNSPITRSAMPLDEVLDLFRERGDEDKLRLMESRSKDYLVVYTLRGVRDYFYGYMLPSTGYLTVWDLQPADGGFLLRYPRRHQPNKLQPKQDLAKLQAVYIETARWLDLVDVEDMGRLNQAIRDGRARELILVAEALHEGRVADLADEVVHRQSDARLVLIAGPSSAGKTTFSRRLAIQLMAHGLKPFNLGLDDYFVDRENTPLDEHGEYDYEHIEAIDLDLFNHDLLRLLSGEETRLSRFNFVTGKREAGANVRLTSDHVVIVEGIHGMNPALIREVPPERAFRIYVSALTQLNIDRYNRVPTTDLRLLRRLVRDASFRGYSAMDTLDRWESVRLGEKAWIFPYQENADVMFNSALVYELAVLGALAEPLLRQIEPGTQRYVEAKRLLSFLSWVRPLAPDLVPDNSLLREFIGGSILQDYEPGQFVGRESD